MPAATTALPPVPAAGLRIGVDTHADVHVAVAIDQFGRRVAQTSEPTSMAGLRRLHAWAHRLGSIIAWGVERTGSYGARLARLLADHGEVVLEVSRPDRRLRRDHGKSDPIDAEAAARAVLAGTALGQPKQSSGVAASLRQLRAARQAAVKARTQAANQLRALLLDAPRTAACAALPTRPRPPGQPAGPASSGHDDAADRPAQARPAQHRPPLACARPRSKRLGGADRPAGPHRSTTPARPTRRRP
jgi:transposase